MTTPALLFLAFTLLPPPAPRAAPQAIAPEVERVQQEHGVAPLPMPAPGDDPVASGLIPADVQAEAEREREKMDRGNAAIVERLLGPTTAPVKLWKGNAVAALPDLTQTKPPEPCTADLEGWRYVDQAQASVCVCARKRWCPEGKMPKTPCAGDATTCR